MVPPNISERQLHYRGDHGPSEPARSLPRTPQQQGTFGAGGEGTPPSCLSPPPKCPPKPSQRGVGLGSPSCNFSQHTASSSFMGGGARCGMHVRRLDALFDWESVSWHLPGYLSLIQGWATVSPRMGVRMNTFALFPFYQTVKNMLYLWIKSLKLLIEGYFLLDFIWCFWSSLIGLHPESL